MTEGRFETVHNLRPQNWDHRRHWTNWHHLYDCEEDHLARESCPFHDLRSGGQFQYENWGGGPHAQPIEPQHLNNRKAGDRMDFAPGRGTNTGGWGDMPLDTDPGRPQEPNIVPRLTNMHTKKNPLYRGLFSDPPYMPNGENDGETDLRGAEEGHHAGDNIFPANRRCGYMKAGGNHPYIGQPAEYIVDPLNDRPDQGRIYHFNTGTVKHDFPQWMPEGEPKRRRKKKYGPFLAGKPNSFNIGGECEWIPDPYDKGKIRFDKRPFRTWHTRTKWSMPTYAPWSTGLSTAEHRKGKNLDLTESGIPNLSKHPKVNMAQTVGSLAALEPIGGPSK
eukprot:gene8986-6308_t